ncbi:MAG: DUF167 domain-containing protein [Dehalococcoidia bacterium]|jgi:hypothetical protein
MADKKTTLTLQVHPNAKRNEVLGFEEGILRLKIAAPPVEGKANKELISFLSKTLGTRKSSITIDRGQTSKVKIVTIEGLARDQIYEMIEASKLK